MNICDYIKKKNFCACFNSTNTNTGMKQRRSTWTLSKDYMQIHEMFCLSKKKEKEKFLNDKNPEHSEKVRNGQGGYLQ